MFSNIGTSELIVILIILVVLFGGNKLTELARGSGEALREFKKAQKDLEETSNMVKGPPSEESADVNDHSTVKKIKSKKHSKGGAKK